MRISLRYGTATMNNVSVANGTSLTKIIRDHGPSLGLPEAVDIYITGVKKNASASPVDGDVITFEKRACEKA